jgi:hypothetical protein
MLIHLKGVVTEDGKLIFDPPKNLPPGKVKITITINEHQPAVEDTPPTDAQDSIDEEIK